MTEAEPQEERMTLNDALAEEIRVALTRRRVKQRELCSVLGLSHAQVSQRLGGTVPLRADEIDDIAAFLQIPVVDLVKRADDARTWINAGMGDPWLNGDRQPAEQVMRDRGIIADGQVGHTDERGGITDSYSSRVRTLPRALPEPPADRSPAAAAAPLATVTALLDFRTGRRAGARARRSRSAS